MTELNDSNRRIDDRLPVRWTATLTDENDKSYDAEIRDISTAGALISCGQDFEIGTDLFLEIQELGEFAGRVCWQGSGSMGLILLVGADLALKKFAEMAGADVSAQPQTPDQDL